MQKLHHRRQNITATMVILALLADLWSLLLTVVCHPKFREIAPVVLIFGSMFLFAFNIAGFATHPYWWGASVILGILWVKF
jgi:hypothetical protein